MNSVPKCSKVYIDCDSNHRIPYWSRVSRGLSVGGCTIVYSHPKTCMLVSGTMIEYVKRCNYSINDNGSNVIINEKCGKRESVYVYPSKVYNELLKLYIEPMANGEQPFNPGLILTGAPGTGKSTLARITSKIIGVPVFEITPDSVLSKYVGESEKSIRRIISNAVENEPSVIIIDDAEWLLSARKLSTMERHESVSLNIKNILFDAMQDLYNNGKRVLFIASTNVKPSEIDPAFLRQGRFGEPVFVPLPDYESVYIVLRNVIGDDRARELSRKVVNMGLSIADALGMAERLKRGLDIDRKSFIGRGYTRVHVEQADFTKLLDKFPFNVFKGRSRIYLHGNEDVMSAVATQLSYHAGVTVVKLVDIRFFDEAVHTANMLNATMIASTSLPPEVQVYINNNLDTTLFLVGKKPPSIEAFTFYPLEALYSVVGKEEILKSVLYYKNVSFTDDIVRKIVNTVSSNTQFTSLLETIATLSYVDEKMVSRIATFVK